jgi:uncharacterized membrane protein
MSEICKNCTEEIVLNFCPNCGQKKSKRIDKTYIKDELQYTLLHMNKGFFYSIKKILRAPGKTAREFLEGNRVNHYKPILLVFVISGISAFLANTIIHPAEIMAQYQNDLNPQPGFDANAFNAFIFKYQSLLMLASLPFTAFFTWLAFKKWGYNYYENVIINAFYFACLQALSIIIIMPLQIVLKDNPLLFAIIPTSLSFLLAIAVTFWFYIELYNDRDAAHIILRLFLLAIIGGLLFFILIILVVTVVVVYSTMNGIDPRTIFPTA